MPERPRIQGPDEGLYTENAVQGSYQSYQIQSRHPGDGFPRQQPEAEPEDGLYTKKEYEETMSTVQSRFPTMNFDTIDPRFMHPFTAIIAGPSQTGKSMFCMRIIRNARECIAHPPEQYSVLLQRLPTFIRLISKRRVLSRDLPDLNMFDGVTNEPCSSSMTSCTKPTKQWPKLFIRVSHHKNVSVVYLTQNLFNNNKHNRTISLERSLYDSV